MDSSVVLLGNPNVGKSALFGALTGTYVTVSNYPGTTVEVTRGTVSVSGQRLILLDTPGAASLTPASEDERVTRDILLAGRPHAAVVVGDAKNLERALQLALQAAELGVPLVLCLNMTDEAQARGIEVDAERLAERLGVDVVPTVAVRHEGVPRLLATLAHPRLSGFAVAYPQAVEDALVAAIRLLPEAPISGRSLALMVLGGDETLKDWLAARLSHEDLSRLEDVRESLARRFPEPVAYVLSRARFDAATRLARLVTAPAQRAARSTSAFAARLERAATHPFWGLVLLAAVLAVSYEFVGVFGARTLVDLLEHGLFGKIVARRPRQRPIASSRGSSCAICWSGPTGSSRWRWRMRSRSFSRSSRTFFIAFGALEDSGYLPRLAVMVNRVFKKMGLNGKAVLPMVLGLGCDTMATLTTRILETRKERLIVTLLLALGVPCSAQLTVVMAMLSGLSVWAVAIWLGVVIGVILIVGRLAAMILPGSGSDFVLELPPLRLPRPGNILVKTLARIEWYLREAVPLFVLGTLLLFGADRLGLLPTIEGLAEPVLKGALGLPRETAEAFVIGFLRRDFGAAGLFDLARQGRLSPTQIVVAMVTITLFIPCIANFFMMVKERGWRTAVAIAAFILPFALGVGAAVNQVLHAIPVPLR